MTSHYKYLTLLQRHSLTIIFRYKLTYLFMYIYFWLRFDWIMVLNTTFNIFQLYRFNWWRKPEYQVKTTDLFASHWQTSSHTVVSSTPRHERCSNSQPYWWYALIAQVVVNSTTMRTRPQRPPCVLLYYHTTVK